ncbi:MAG: phosphate signaling complex protein PhoU [Anaerolineae bacterium]|nr:phosphate signaling complex protein PhoU [Anaerolineae bacterium]
MRLELERERARIHQALKALSEQAAAESQRAVRALLSGDVEEAFAVREEDKAADAMRYQLENECVAAIARQQPVGQDARELLAASIVAVELERCGDYAKGVARAARRIIKAGGGVDAAELAKMDAIVRSMLERSTYAFLKQDSEAANQVLHDDDLVDQIYEALVRHTLDRMIETPSTIESNLWLLHAAHCLERIGDRATNIAEQALFVITGETPTDRN